MATPENWLTIQQLKALKSDADVEQFIEQQKYSVEIAALLRQTVQFMRDSEQNQLAIQATQAEISRRLPEAVDGFCSAVTKLLDEVQDVISISETAAGQLEQTNKDLERYQREFLI